MIVVRYLIEWAIPAGVYAYWRTTGVLPYEMLQLAVLLMILNRLIAHFPLSGFASKKESP